MSTEFEVTYVDGSCDVVCADSHERVGDEEHFVRAVGRSGEERITVLAADRIQSIVARRE